MSDSNQPRTDGTNTGDTPTDPAAKPTENQGDFDPTKLSDDQFSKVFNDPRTFKHPRFAELNQKAKKAEKLEQDIKAADEAKLAENNEFKTLAEQRANEIKELKAQNEKVVVDSRLTVALTKAGVVDVEAGLTFVDRSLLKTNDGSVEGIDVAVAKLKEAKSYLFGGTTPVGDGTNPAGGSGNQPSKTFYRSQLRDNNFYKANEADILKANREGRIVDDISDPTLRPS